MFRRFCGERFALPFLSEARGHFNTRDLPHDRGMALAQDICGVRENSEGHEFGSITRASYAKRRKLRLLTAPFYCRRHRATKPHAASETLVARREHRIYAMSVSTIDSTIPGDDALNIVVIGASAGGVDALTTLFRHIPDDICAAFLVVLHIPPHTPSSLHRILSTVTPLRVLPATTSMALEMKTVYVGVADRHIMLEPAGIRVTRGPKECRARPAIDVLFRSAAQAYGARVIGVILSGALDDGTAGLWAVKDRGGMAMVQTPSDAMHASMPESAIEHVTVDFVGSLESLAKEIARCVGTPVASHAIPVAEGLAIENLISASGDGLAAGVMGLGKVSRDTCPDCHGVLVQIEEGSVTRFRCHTGHAFSIKTLIAEINAAIDSGLWNTLRAIEERVMLLRQIATLAGQSGSPLEMLSCQRQANEAERRLQPLRELLLDANFFGHDPARP